MSYTRCRIRISISVLLAALFGILIPDFRYDTLSLLAVIAGRPLLAIALSLWACPGTHGHGKRSQVSAGIAALVIENLAGLARFVYDTGDTLWTERLSAGIFVASFAAQLAFFGAALFVIFAGRRALRRRL